MRRILSVVSMVLLLSVVVLAAPVVAFAQGPAPDSAAAAQAIGSLETTPPVRMEDDHPRARFSGKWGFRAGDLWSGQTARATQTRGATALIVFDGTSVSVIGRVGPDRGLATVYLDGVATATVSAFATDYASNAVLWSAPELAPGRHTLRVVAAGAHEASSTGSWLYIDAFDIVGERLSPGIMPGKRVQNGDARLYVKSAGSWTKEKRVAAYGDSAIRTSTKGAAITLKFRGTGAIWYGRKSPSGGVSSVYLDGKKVAVVSQYASPTVEPRVAWGVSGLKNATHTVRIVCESATSTPDGGKRTEFDAFQVNGTVLTAPRPTPFKYPWKTYIVIDKSQFKLYWVKNNVLVKTYPIAHGKVSTPTPNHVWRIDAKYKTSGVYGPRKMRLFRGYKTGSGWRFVFTRYGIHGTNQEWVIGTRASHGCIRMYNKDVLELWPQVPMHTIVITRD